MRTLNLSEIQMVNGSGFIGGGFILAPIIAGISTILLSPSVDLWFPIVQQQASRIMTKIDPELPNNLQAKIPESIQQFDSSNAKLFCIGATSYLIARFS